MLKTIFYYSKIKFISSRRRVKSSMYLIYTTSKSQVAEYPVPSLFTRKIPYNVWLHLTFTWDQGLTLGQIFFNGTKVGSKVSLDGKLSYSVGNTSHSFYQIGNRQGDGRSLHGLFRKLKVFKKVLNSSEIITEMKGM